MITYGSTTLTSYNSIVKTEVYYYKSTSATSLSGGSWATTKPTWENGKYIWQKIRTVYEDGTHTESDPVNITGQQGATGTAAYSYKLNSSDSIIGKTKDGEYTIKKITFSATCKQGTGAVSAYNGRFKIESTTNGSTWKTEYTSSGNESSKEFTIPDDIILIKCSLYQSDGTTVLLDIVTVPVVKDGVDAIGLRDSIPYYLASDKDTGITRLTQGWTRYRPQLTAEKKYLWVYYASRYSEGTTEPELIEIKDDLVHFVNNGDEAPVESCVVDIEPIQDLHGYDSPWPAGGGKNIIPYPYNGGDSKTLNGITFTVNNDSSVKVQGTATSTAYFNLFGSNKTPIPSWIKPNTAYYLQPAALSGKYFVQFILYGSTSYVQTGGVTFTTPADLSGYTGCAIVIGVYNGAVVNDTIYPMLEYGTIASTWSPYSNICPITGWTGAKVTRAGKNLWNPKLYDGGAYNPSIGAVWNLSESATQFAQDEDTFSLVTSKTWEYYTLLFDIADTSLSYYRHFTFTSDSTGGVTEAYLDKDFAVIWRKNSTDTTQIRNGSFSIPMNAKYYAVVITNRGTAEATLSIKAPQIELGSTATDYEPYSGQTYDITFPTEAGTVYGGTLDVTSGVLTVDRAIWTGNTADMNNSENYPGWANAGIIDIVGVGLNSGILNAISNVSPAITSGRYAIGVNTLSSSNTGVLWLNKNYFNKNQTKWKALALDVQIVLPLATPITYQLTPQEITMLCKENNIFTDTGQTAISYYDNQTSTDPYVDYSLTSAFDASTIEPAYIETEWVESTGKQYVYLDWKPPIKTWGFEIDFISYNALGSTVGAWNEDTNKNGYGTIFGTRNASGVNNAQLSSYNNGLLRIGNGTNQATSFKTNHTRQQIKLQNTTITKTDGTTSTVSRLDETANKPYCNMTVFGQHEGLRCAGNGGISEPSSTRIYSLKFYDGDTLTVDLVGAIRKRDSVTGLYDKVSKHFYPAPGMLFGDVIGDIGDSISMKEAMDKANPQTIVVNKDRTRMWEATVPFNDLQDGQKITVTYSYGNIVSSVETDELIGWDDTSNNQQVYLKLTFADGHKTDWIPCYYSNTGRLTTHYGAGIPIQLTYRENILANASETASGNMVLRGFYADANYDSNNTDIVRWSYGRVIAGSNKIFPYSIIMQNEDERWESIITSSTTAKTKTKNTHGFRLDTILYQAANTTTNENAENTSNQLRTGDPIMDMRYNLNIEDTNELRLVHGKSVYLVGTVGTDGLFYLADQWWSQSLPTTEDGKIYIFLGQVYDWYRCGLATMHPIYKFVDGKLKSTLQIAVDALDKAKEVAQDLADLGADLQAQIDGKIETWCQQTDPSTAWTTTELKNQHNGDLWYYTGESTSSYKNNTTYKYTASTNKWTAYSASTDLFDKIDAKTSIYYGKPSTVTQNLEVGDYLVDSTDGCSYRWDGSKWVKLTDYKATIDNIEIGGRNLWKDSSLTGNISEYTYHAYWDKTIKDGYKCLHYSGQLGKAYPLGRRTTIPDFTPWAGLKMVISCDVLLENITRGTTNYFVGFYMSGETIDGHWTAPAIIKTQNLYGNGTNFDYVNLPDKGWQRAYLVFEFGDYNWSTKNWMFSIYNRDFTGDLYIKNVKVEFGNMPTDWTPAPEDTEAEISALQEDLQSQIDEKIQTYYQSTNPASAWTTADIRATHDGDLWCYTGTTTSTYTKDNVYRYSASNNTWTTYSASGDLFDKVDGKTTVFYGKTTDTFADVETGDYLVDATDGSSYRYDGSKWVKVTDYQAAIDEIEVGGRNLLKKEPKAYSSTKYGAYDLALTEPLEAGQTYTIQLWDVNVSHAGKTVEQLGINVYYCGGTVTFGNWIGSTFFTDGHADHLTLFFTPTEANINHNDVKNALIKFIRLYNSVPFADGAEYMSVGKWKLEKGNKPTDYSVAPEDVDASISTAQTTADTAMDRATAIYGTCSTATGTAAKAVTCPNFVLFDGARIQVTFTNTNTASAPTLNVNSTGAKAIYINKTVTSSSNLLLWTAGSKMEFVYDGTGWIAQNVPYALYGTCSTGASTAAKAVTCNEAVICKGTTISVNMTNTNTAANATMNVGSTLAKDIYANGAKLTTNSRFNWRANTTQKFVFDGQVWRMDDDSVKALATAYITEIDDDGIMVHPEDDDTSGWAISDAIQLFKSGISYIKLWIENNIPKIRIGKEDQGHIILDNDSVDIRNDDTVLASFGATSVIGDTNDWHQTIAANQITFAKGDDIITYISPDKLYTINAEVADAFYISNYSIRNASDGKLVIGLRR